MEGRTVDHVRPRDRTVRRICIVIHSEHALLRQAVAVAFEQEEDLLVVGKAESASQAVVEAERLGPDVAVIDVGSFHGAGLQAVSAMRRALPSCKVIVLVDDQGIPSLVRSLEAGASGYLAKTSSLQHLVRATRAVVDGRIVIPPSLLDGLIGALLQRKRDVDGAFLLIHRLTRREREVLVLLSEGANNTEIGQILAISPQTARTHVQKILAKLAVHSRLEAAALARQSGAFEELDAVDWGEPAWTEGTSPVLAAAR
jgi:DNA-binding NarL/FixJ family response regulator